MRERISELFGPLRFTGNNKREIPLFILLEKKT